MPGIKGLGGMGDEAAEALRKLLKSVDEGVDVEDLMYPEDAAGDTAEFLSRIGMRNYEPRPMTVEQQIKFDDAAAAQREYAARVQQEAERKALEEMFQAADEDERLRQMLRNLGFEA